MSRDREREMFDAKCGDCGNDCQIPFKPKEDSLFIAENVSKITDKINRLF